MDAKTKAILEAILREARKRSCNGSQDDAQLEEIVILAKRALFNE